MGEATSTRAPPANSRPLCYHPHPQPRPLPPSRPLPSSRPRCTAPPVGASAVPSRASSQDDATSVPGFSLTWAAFDLDRIQLGPVSRRSSTDSRALTLPSRKLWTIGLKQRAPLLSPSRRQRGSTIDPALIYSGQEPFGTRPFPRGRSEKEPMQHPVRYTPRHPLFLNHTPRALKMDTKSLPDLPDEAHALPQLSSLDYDPFEDFDAPSQFRSTSANGYSSNTPPDLDNEDYDRPSSPLEGNEDASDYFQSKYHNQSLSTTDTGHSTSVSSPRPRFWNSTDSADFECAVAGEYSPYDNDLSADSERGHSSATDRLHTSHSLNYLNMKAPPILSPHLQRQASLPMPNNTYDLAFFLKNTNPPNYSGGASTHPTKEDAVARRKSKHKSPLRFLRVTRRSLASKIGSTEGPDERDVLFPKSFVPPEGVVQKVSRDGKKYLQIVTDDKSMTSHLDIPTNNDSQKKHSVAFSDRTDTPDTDVLESWLSFNLQKQGEDDVKCDHDMSKAVRLIKQHDHLEIRHHEGELTTVAHEDATHDPPISQNRSKPDQASTNLEESSTSNLQSLPPDLKAALFSNPPSTRQSAAGMPEAACEDQSPESDSDSVELPEFPRPPSEETRVSLERGKERLAGQGLHRPSVKDADEQPEPPPKDDVNDTIRTREDSGVGQLCQRDPSEFGLGAKDSTRKSREERIRARKLRDMQRIKSNIDEVVGRGVESPTSPESMSTQQMSPVQERHSEPSPSKIVEEPERPVSELSTVRSSLDSRVLGDGHSRHISIDTVSTAPTPGFTTGYTPTSSRMSLTLTPIMLVAEQIPVTKSKPTKKPARLILRDHQTPQSSIIATHEPVESSAESIPVAPAVKERSGLRHFSAPANLPSTSTDVGTAIPTNRHLRNHRHTPSRASCASTAIGPQTRDQLQEAQMEALQRENRLLEAALMAVLKSGGRLNKCPCQLKGGAEGEGADETAGEEKGALEVYLATRVGGGL
ncbi:uncharacterized protein BDZ99DRAFT_476470 [Mytilinidion resinicola]|uniref:Uncharacterized protein n=1 Tax=Mytilinidion resinicola TaxID=574789 RepID=A0A6A6YN41_9PEZI|nr:uncharacterized protein BDZ99DRAFT_476470 [Mytilinidion resinicola]KAF2810292.1 hypothetical protein BDZ99DRAFT_476470 [Mytilinidion resinicola]